MKTRRISLEGYVSVPLPRCACGAEPMIVSPGRAAAVDNLLEFDGGEPDRGWCICCAVLLGWPNWPGERRRTRT